MRIVLAVLLALVVGETAAWAALGEYENSVSLDQQTLGGKHQVIARQGYTLHQITSASGMTLKEYVSPAGLVFGVSWHGPTMPNLQQLLGSYFTAFAHAPRARARRRGPLVVRTDKLVVESAGHMRSFHGRAYVTSLIPDALSPEVVQ